MSPATILDTALRSPGAPSRRQFLTGSGLVGALWGARQARAGAGAPAPHSLGDTLPPSESTAIKLVRRITMGLTEEEVARVEELGYEGYLEYQLDYEAIDDSELEAYIEHNFPLLFLEPPEYRELMNGQLINQLLIATVVRSIRSRRQLHQRMVEFWTDHFNVDIRKGAGPRLKPVDDREVIRRHALGFFPDLLRANARSPAMLFYLDNFTNRVGNPNENYSRELMELHTLGVGEFREADVVELARILTGWSIETRNPKTWGTFKFEPRFHDNDPKVFLGQVIHNPDRPIRDIEEALDILVAHPSTARYIASKMSKWLWGYEPSEAMVDQVAGVYAATGGDIRAMVRVILRQGRLRAAPPKFKRPYHLVTSTLRAVNANLGRTRGLAVLLERVGQIPMFWETPDGYPDALEHWVGLQLSRWNVGFSVMNNEVGMPVNILDLLGDARMPADIVDRIDALLLGGEMTESLKDELIDFLPSGQPSEAQVRDAFALALASPSYQWY